MRSVRRKDTAPELKVRRVLHGLGLRFRIHRKDLPGSPDVVLPSRRIAIFVHGCFWHRHEECQRTTTPKSNRIFWLDKFRKNVARDRRNELALIELGWKVVVVWECETRNDDELEERLRMECAKE